jgi:beta-lactamase regulating signal transducer with metallopeptidase domain
LPQAQAEASSAAPTSVAPRLRHWPAVVGAILLAAMTCGMGWLLLGVMAVRQQRLRSRPVSDSELLQLIDSLRAELGCRRPVEVRQSDDLTTAATIGWRRPVVLLPADWRTWTAAERRAVLAHEIAHARSHDFLALLLGHLGLMLHFYHPLLRWLMGRLRLEQELVADAAAANVSGGQRQYLITIAELALRQPDRSLSWPIRAFLPTQTTFLKRIAMLRDSHVRFDRPSAAMRSVTVGAVLLCGLLIAGLRGSSAPKQVETDEPATVAQVGKPGPPAKDQPAPPPARQRATASPAKPAAADRLDEVLSWLPADTETILGGNGPFALAVPHKKAPSDHPAIDEMAKSFPALMMSGLLEKRVAPKELTGLSISLAVGAIRGYRSPRGPKDLLSCGVIMVEKDGEQALEAVMRSLLGKAGRRMQVAGKATAVFEERVEKDTQTVFIAQPRPNVLLCASQEGILKEVLENTERKPATRITLRDFPEWKYVNTKSTAWAIRHYRKAAAAKGRSSPERNDADSFHDPDAVGFSYSYNPATKEATICYLTHPQQNAVAIMVRSFPIGLGWKFEEIKPGVARVTTAFDKNDAGVAISLWLLVALFDAKLDL